MTAKQPPQIDLSWIVVNDLAKSIKFFTEVVGLKLLERDDNFGWAELGGNNGARLGLAQKSPYNPSQPGSNAVVTFTVSNLDQSKAEMSKKGMQLIGDVMEVPGEVKLQTFADADGNQFQLVECLRQK